MLTVRQLYDPALLAHQRSPAVFLHFILFFLSPIVQMGSVIVYSRPSTYPGSNQPQVKSIKKVPKQNNSKKHSRKFQKAKVELPHAGNFLQSIYIVFTTVYIAFTLY